MAVSRQTLRDAIEKHSPIKEEDLPGGIQELLGEHKEYRRLPLRKINLFSQVRTEIDTEGDNFKVLVESIREKGVLQPILVNELPDGNYRLIAGERRYRASLLLDLKSIPAIIKEKPLSDSEILSFQLIENLQREDLTPLDEAQGYFELFKYYAGAQEIRECINNLLLLERSPERVKNEFVVTVTTIQKISGKSISSVKNLLSLVRLPEEIKKALSDGQITLSQGYVFASNLEHPRLKEIFYKAVEGKFTKDALQKELKREINKKKASKSIQEIVKSLNKSLIKASKELESSNALLTEKERKELLALLRKLILQLEVLS